MAPGIEALGPVFDSIVDRSPNARYTL